MKSLIYLIVLFFSFNCVLTAQESNSQENERKIESLELKYDELLIQVASIDSNLKNKFESFIAKDKELLRNFYALNRKIKNNVDSIGSLTDNVGDNKLEIAKHTSRLTELNSLISNVEVSYAVLENALKINSDLIEQLADDISYLELSYDIVQKEYKIMAGDLKLQKNRIDSIPDIYFCKECLPEFKIQLNKGFFPSNLYYINARSSVEALISIRLQRRLLIDISYQMISINTISEPLLMEFEESVFDKWDLGIISAGIKYNIKDPVGKKFNAEALLGGIIGFGSIDNFYNQQNLLRSVQDFQNYYGIYTGINFIYSELSDKLPLEIILGLRSMISFQEIIFDAGVNDPINIGNFLPQATIGLRCNFNFKK